MIQPARPRRRQPTRPRPSVYPDSPDQVLIDSELGRLSVALKLAAAFRFWLVGHHLSRQRGGCGWAAIDDLWAAVLEVPDYEITRRHFRRILQEGNDVFWKTSQDRIYLTSITNLAADLMIEAGLRGLSSVIETNQPGGYKSVWIPIGGSHEQWEASLYAGWLGAKAHTTIARDTLAGLWNRSPKTLRRWEQSRLADRLTVVPNYAAVQNPEISPAEDTFYDSKIKSKAYQLPNTYQVAARQTPRNGQRQKVRRAVTGSYLGAGADTRRLYFETMKGLQAAYRRQPDGPMRFTFLFHRRGSNYWRRTADIFV